MVLSVPCKWLWSTLVSLLCQQHTRETTASKGEKGQWARLGETRTSCCSWLHCSDIKRGNSQLRNHSKLLSVSLPMPGSGRTLRETVLESSPILALLNESFISSWSLVKELEELQVSVTSLPLHSRCSQCLAGDCQ